MSSIESRLRALGLSLPPPTQPPAGVVLPFQFVHVVGRRALISGHGPQNPDGSFALPFGKLGRELTVEQGYVAARMTALSILGSLKRTLGAWSTRLRGSTNSRASSTDFQTSFSKSSVLLSAPTAVVPSVLLSYRSIFPLKLKAKLNFTNDPAASASHK